MFVKYTNELEPCDVLYSVDLNKYKRMTAFATIVAERVRIEKEKQRRASYNYTKYTKHPIDERWTDKCGTVWGEYYYLTEFRCKWGPPLFSRSTDILVGPKYTSQDNRKKRTPKYWY